MSKLNIILIIIIITIFAVLGYLGFKSWRRVQAPTVNNTPSTAEAIKQFKPMPIINKGKESEERDAALEADVRKIDSAVKEYAKDHSGRYPMSYFKDPCQAVRYCLKGVNINSREKAYLNPIPQVKSGNLDYHYTADNEKKTYCAKTPMVLETANTMVFQCSHDACGRVEFKDSCQ